MGTGAPHARDAGQRGAHPCARHHVIPAGTCERRREPQCGCGRRRGCVCSDAVDQGRQVPDAQVAVHRDAQDGANDGEEEHRPKGVPQLAQAPRGRRLRVGRYRRRYGAARRVAGLLVQRIAPRMGRRLPLRQVVVGSLLRHGAGRRAQLWKMLTWRRARRASRRSSQRARSGAPRAARMARSHHAARAGRTRR